MDEGLISGPADIFTLQKGRHCRFGKIWRKIGAKSHEADRESQKRFLWIDFYTHLGIFHVGQETAKALAKKFMASRQTSVDKRS